MDPQKPNFSLRMRQELRTAIEEAFRREKYEKTTDVRSTGAFAEQLIEFVWLQYQAAGTLKKLLSTNVLEAIRAAIVNQAGDVISTRLSHKEIIDRQVRSGENIGGTRAKGSRPKTA
jgi:hypothetical protein